MQAKAGPTGGCQAVFTGAVSLARALDRRGDVSIASRQAPGLVQVGSTVRTKRAKKKPAVRDCGVFDRVTVGAFQAADSQ